LLQHVVFILKRENFLLVQKVSLRMLKDKWLSEVSLFQNELVFFVAFFSRFMSYFSVSTLPSFKPIIIIIIIIWTSLKLERNFSFFMNFFVLPWKTD